jgi:hypothetical protein
MATIQYVGDGGPDGTVVGKASTSLVAFWGGTPQARPSGTGQADIASTASVSISATQWGFSTSTQATAIVTLVRAMRAALANTGFMAGA